MIGSERFDIVMASDLRLPGGTTASMAEEIRAHAAAGYRTAIFHVSSRLSRKRDLGIEPRIRQCIDEGLATLLLPGDRAHARLAVVRNASVFEAVPSSAPEVSADHVVLVVNNVAEDAAGQRHFDPVSVNATLTGLFGSVPRWFPIGPAVRRTLGPYTAVLDLSDTDWLNLIDVTEWSVPRRELSPSRSVVIGRHSRSHPAKWPDDAESLLALYPPHRVVRVLGGADPVRETLGEIPAHWIVEEFGARDPRDFVADLDFFVYFHRADLIEAYGRTIMEAMASGAVAVLPEHFREAFGDAAVYATPHEVQPLIDALTADPRAYRAQSALGQEFIARTHGYQVHVDRVAALIGAAPGQRLDLRSRTRPRGRVRVLFVSSNGAGMGHLTRLLAMATRGSARIEPIFFSMSQAVPVVSSYGFPWEYCPSRGDLGTSAQEWNPFFAERCAEVIRRYAPRAVVFDGTMPYLGLVAARTLFPNVLFVWSRRGMWREGTTEKFLSRGDGFDLVIEPGEVAAAADAGPTTTRTDARRVGPVTLVSADEVLSRAEARAALGMDPDAPALLLSLGAGNINDTASDLGILAEAAADLPGGWQTFVTKAPIARSDGPGRGEVRTLSVYPLARYLRAFDAGVVAAGYNSFHEVVAAGLPCVFVPNTATVTDDQVARARYAQSEGFGVCLEQVSPESARSALTRVTESGLAEAASARAAKVAAHDGAREAMTIIEGELEKRGILL